MLFISVMFVSHLYSKEVHEVDCESPNSKDCNHALVDEGEIVNAATSETNSSYPLDSVQVRSFFLY